MFFFSPTQSHVFLVGHSISSTKIIWKSYNLFILGNPRGEESFSREKSTVAYMMLITLGLGILRTAKERFTNPMEIKRV